MSSELVKALHGLVLHELYVDCVECYSVMADEAAYPTDHLLKPDDGGAAAAGKLYHSAPSSPHMRVRGAPPPAYTPVSINLQRPEATDNNQVCFVLL